MRAKAESVIRAMRLPLALLVALVLAACGNPVPPEKKDYIGVWESSTPAMSMHLSISKDGDVSYKRLERSEHGTSSTVMNVPLKRFQGDNFEVGVGPASTVFTVSKPPHWVKDDLWMVVDGIELKRVELEPRTFK